MAGNETVKGHLLMKGRWFTVRCYYDLLPEGLFVNQILVFLFLQHKIPRAPGVSPNSRHPFGILLVCPTDFFTAHTMSVRSNQSDCMARDGCGRDKCNRRNAFSVFQRCNKDRVIDRIVTPK